MNFLENRGQATGVEVRVQVWRWLSCPPWENKCPIPLKHHHDYPIFYREPQITINRSWMGLEHIGGRKS